MSLLSVSMYLGHACEPCEPYIHIFHGNDLYIISARGEVTKKLHICLSLYADAGGNLWDVGPVIVKPVTVAILCVCVCFDGHFST